MKELWRKIISTSHRGYLSTPVAVYMFAISLLLIVAAIVDYGFELSENELVYIYDVYRIAWWSYAIALPLRLLTRWQRIRRNAPVMTILFGIFLYLPLVASYINIGGHSGILTGLYNVIIDKYYLIAILGVFALMEISKDVVRFINKKTNPALILAVGFALIILIGTILLLLPRSTQEGVELSIIDSLFVSTSAVCVTGLSPVDIATTFTIEGEIVLMLLIQIGGLGVMTITSFFVMFFMGGTNLYNQFALRDMIGSDTFNSLISTLLHIIGFTLAIEMIGGVAIFFDIHGELGMNVQDEMFFSIFHAISAFCNAGFSTLEGNLSHPLIIEGHNMFFLIISVLVVLGGIGFPILVNFRNILGYHLRRMFQRLRTPQRRRIRYRHTVNINTKMVVRMSLFLIVVGSIIIGMCEWNGAFVQMPIADKIVHSIFNAVVPRTAGFVGVDVAEMSFFTIAVYMLLMWIGGASQSTAGGIKVNTFGVAIANFKSIIRGRNSVVLFDREISPNSVRRASATIFGSICIILIFFLTLTELEPHHPRLSLLFETISAFSTVGASLNLTPLLCDESKILLSILMFVGRVGFITVVLSIVPVKGDYKIGFPKDDVIIN